MKTKRGQTTLFSSHFLKIASLSCYLERTEIDFVFFYVNFNFKK